jgi:hypothetical protein
MNCILDGYYKKMSKNYLPFHHQQADPYSYNKHNGVSLYNKQVIPYHTAVTVRWRNVHHHVSSGSLFP